MMMAGMLAGAGMGKDSVLLSITSNPASNEHVRCAALPADGKPVEQIAFLFLRLKDNAVTLDKIRIANGSLKLPKKQRQYGDAIQYELLSGTGIVVHADSIGNPLIKRLEYEDPAQPGHLKLLLVKEKEASFVIRVPWTKDMKQIRFQRRKEGTATAPKTSCGVSGKIVLGTITLPAMRETP